MPVVSDCSGSTSRIGAGSGIRATVARGSGRGDPVAADTGKAVSPTIVAAAASRAAARMGAD
jgi:hypothetical protein